MAPAQITAISNDTASVPESPKAVTNGNGVSEMRIAQKQIITDEAIPVKLPKSEELVPRTFDCFKHVKPSQFPEALGPLPFPHELRGLVAWADAFVERLGLEALKEQEKSHGYELRIRRFEQDKEALNKRIVELQTKLHEAVDEAHKFKAKAGKLDCRNKFLEGQRKRDEEQIASQNMKIGKQQTEIYNLILERDLLMTRVEGLKKTIDDMIDHHNGDEKDKKAMIDSFEAWKEADRKHDKEVEDLVKELRKQLECESEAKSAAEAGLLLALGGMAELEAENTDLCTRRDQLQELLNCKREELQKLEAKFGVSQGKVVTLTVEVTELKKQEESYRQDIEHLYVQLDDAKANVEEARKQVNFEIEHAKHHWNVLDNIRVDMQHGEKHACECPHFVHVPAPFLKL